MPPRLFVDGPLPSAGASFALPPTAARHVQVLRLQPGDALVLFDGSGPEWPATVTAMGRQSVEVELGSPSPAQRELMQTVRLAVVMPANDRMDGVIEKATELGAAVIQPLMSERSVLRLSGERADKKRQHWRGVAIAAAEQCGRSRVPEIAPVLTLAQWLAALPPAAPGEARAVLSPTATPGLAALARADAVTTLSGPEGGLSDAEIELARAAGFAPLQLGPRILRADTAPLAVLGWLALQALHD